MRFITMSIDKNLLTSLQANPHYFSLGSDEKSSIEKALASASTTRAGMTRLSSGEFVSTDSFNLLPTENRSILLKKGTTFYKDWLDRTLGKSLESSKLISNDDWDRLTEEQKTSFLASLPGTIKTNEGYLADIIKSRESYEDVVGSLPGTLSQFQTAIANSLSAKEALQKAVNEDIPATLSQIQAAITANVEARAALKGAISADAVPQVELLSQYQRGLAEAISTKAALQSELTEIPTTIAAMQKAIADAPAQIAQNQSLINTYVSTGPVPYAPLTIDIANFYGRGPLSVYLAELANYTSYVNGLKTQYRAAAGTDWTPSSPTVTTDPVTGQQIWSQARELSSRIGEGLDVVSKYNYVLAPYYTAQENISTINAAKIANQSQIPILQAKLTSYPTQISSLTSSIQDYQTKIPELEAQLSKSSISIPMVLEEYQQAITDATNSKTSIEEALSKIPAAIEVRQSAISEAPSLIAQNNNAIAMITQGQSGWGRYSYSGLLEIYNYAMSLGDPSNYLSFNYHTTPAALKVYVDKYKTLIKPYQDSITAINTNVVNYQAQISDLQSQKVSYETSLSSLTSKISEYESKIPELESQLTEYSSTLPAFDSTISEYEAAAADLLARKTDYESRIPVLTAAIESYGTQSGQIQSDISKYTAELSTLKDKETSFKDAISNLAKQRDYYGAKAISTVIDTSLDYTPIKDMTLGLDTGLAGRLVKSKKTSATKKSKTLSDIMAVRNMR